MTCTSFVSNCVCTWCRDLISSQRTASFHPQWPQGCLSGSRSSIIGRWLTHYIAELHITLRHAKIKTPHPTCTHTYTIISWITTTMCLPPKLHTHTHTRTHTHTYTHTRTHACTHAHTHTHKHTQRLFSRMSAHLQPTLHHTHPYAQVNCWTINRRCVWVWN